MLTSDLHEEKRLRRAAEKGKHEADCRVVMLEQKDDELQTSTYCQDRRNLQVDAAVGSVHDG